LLVGGFLQPTVAPASGRFNPRLLHMLPTTNNQQPTTNNQQPTTNDLHQRTV
jgi:hypothetical protein